MRKTFIAAFLFVTGQAAVPALAQTAEELYKEGLQFKTEKKIPEAVQRFKSALLLDKNYTAALYELGWCQNYQKNFTGALESLRKAREGWPSVPKVYFELGYAFEKLERLDSATAAYNKCLQLKPDYKGAYKQLGYISYAKDDYTVTLERFSKYEELMLAAGTEITDYLYWYRKGFANNALKNFDEAKIALKKSLEFKKDYTNTYYELGFAASRLKANDEAISYFKQAIAIDPQSHIGYNGIGEIYRDNIKNRDEAMVWYRKSLEVNPKERKACYGMGYCLNTKERFIEAIGYFRTAIQESPDYVAAYVELGYSLYKTGKDDEALENLKKAITLNPKNENSRYYATLVYNKQKNKAMAQKMVDELKQLSSKYVTELQQKVNAM